MVRATRKYIRKALLASGDEYFYVRKPMRNRPSRTVKGPAQTQKKISVARRKKQRSA